HLTRVRVNQRRASISLHSSLKLSAIHSFRPQERASETRWRPAGTRGSKRTDREIAQPQIGKTALLPDPEQRPIERQPDRVISLCDTNAEASAEVASADGGPAAKGTAILGIGAVEPERERDRIAEQEIDVAAPQREPRQVRARIGANLDLGKQGLKISLMRCAAHHPHLLPLHPPRPPTFPRA